MTLDIITVKACMNGNEMILVKQMMVYRCIEIGNMLK